MDKKVKSNLFTIKLNAMKYLLLLFGTLSILVMSSCDKSLSINDISNDKLVAQSQQNYGNDYKIIDGIMCFDNPLSLETVIKEIYKMSAEERTLKEQSLGFKSLWRATDEAFDIISNPTNLSEVNEFLIQYGNLVKLSEINGEKYIKARVSSKSLSFIANIDGLFIIGDNICKVIGDYIVESTVEDIDKIAGINHNNLYNISDSSAFRIQKTLQEKRLKTGCGYQDDDDQTSSDGKYKVETEIRIVSYYLSGYQYADVEQTTTNYKKTLGIFFKNKADLAQGGSFSISYIHDGNSGTESTSGYTVDYNVKEIDYLRYCVTIEGYAEDWVCWFDSYSAWGSSDEVDRGNAVVSCS